MKINIFSVVRTDLSTLTQKFVTNKYIIQLIIVIIEAISSIESIFLILINSNRSYSFGNS